MTALNRYQASFLNRWRDADGSTKASLCGVWFRTTRHAAQVFGLGVLMSLTVATPAAASNANAGMDIVVQGARPLAEFANEMQQRYGVVVNYEDPVYAFRGDLTPLKEFKPASGLGRKRYMIPAGTEIAVSLMPSPHNPLLTPVSVVSAAVQQHSSTGQPGRFRVEQTGSVLSIVPDQIRNRDGVWTNVSPIMDAAITVPSGLKDGQTALIQICDELSKTTSRTIRIGNVPANLISDISISVGGGAVTARQMMTNLVAESARPLSWRLFYDANLDAYVMNLMVVSSESEQFSQVQRKPQARSIGD